MERWQLETAERLASIERSIKYIEANLSNLPPSHSCLEAQKKLQTRIEVLEDFKKYVTIRIAWVAGAFTVVATGVSSAFETIKEALFKLH